MRKRHAHLCIANARTLTAWVVMVSVWLSPLELYARRPLPTTPTPRALPQQARSHSRPLVRPAMVDAVVEAAPVKVARNSRDVTFQLRPNFPAGSNAHEQLYGLLTAMGEAVQDAGIQFDDPEMLQIPWRFQIALPPALVGQPSRDLFDLLGMTAYAQTGIFSRNIEITVDPSKSDFDRVLSGFGEYFKDAYGSDAKTITLTILRGLGISFGGGITSQLIEDIAKSLTTQFQKKAFAYFQAAVLTVMLGSMILDWVDYARNGQWEELGASIALFVEGTFYYLLGDLSRRALASSLSRPIRVQEPTKTQPAREPVTTPNDSRRIAEQFMQSDTGGGMLPGPRPPGGSGGGGGTAPRISPPPGSGGTTAVATAPRTGVNAAAALKEVQGASGVNAPQAPTLPGLPKADGATALSGSQVQIQGAALLPASPTFNTARKSYLKDTYGLDFSAWEWRAETLDSARTVSINGKPLQVHTLKAGALEEYQAYARWQSAIDAKWPVQIPVTELWAIAYKDIPGKYGVVAVQEVKGQTPGELQQEAQTLDRQVSSEHWTLIRMVDERNGRTLRRDLAATRPIDVRFGGYDARTGTYQTLYLYNNSDATLMWQTGASARNKTNPLSSSERSTVQTRYKPDTLITQDVSINIHGVTQNNKAAVQSWLNEASPSHSSEPANNYFSDLTPEELEKAKEQIRRADEANQETLRRTNTSGNSSHLATVLRFLETGVLEHNTLAALEAVALQCQEHDFRLEYAQLCEAIRSLMTLLTTILEYQNGEILVELLASDPLASRQFFELPPQVRLRILADNQLYNLREPQQTDGLIVIRRKGGAQTPEAERLLNVKQAIQHAYDFVRALELPVLPSNKWVRINSPYQKVLDFELKFQKSNTQNSTNDLEFKFADKRFNMTRFALDKMLAWVKEASEDNLLETSGLFEVGAADDRGKIWIVDFHPLPGTTSSTAWFPEGYEFGEATQVSNPNLPGEKYVMNNDSQGKYLEFAKTYQDRETVHFHSHHRASPYQDRPSPEDFSELHGVRIIYTSSGNLVFYRVDPETKVRESRPFTVPLNR